VDLVLLLLALLAWFVVGSIVGTAFFHILDGQWPDPDDAMDLYMVAFTAIFWPIFLGFGIIMLISKRIASLFYK
jgi:hypothetical protein